MGRKDTDAEDLAIQDTLSMSVQERLELLANLIVDKIADDQDKGQPLLNQILRARNGHSNIS
jgi:hypothetical protein